MALVRAAPAAAAPLRAALNTRAPPAGARMVSVRAGNQINPSIKKDVEKVSRTSERAMMMRVRSPLAKKGPHTGHKQGQ